MPIRLYRYFDLEGDGETKIKLGLFSLGIQAQTRVSIGKRRRKYMTKRQREMNIKLAVDFMEEIKMLASSVTEDVSDSESMTEAWNKIDRFYKDIESMRNKQKCTGSKSESESNMNVNIGDKVKIEATIVDYNEGAKTVKIRIEGLQEDGYTSTERYIRVKSENFEKITNA